MILTLSRPVLFSIVRVWVVGKNGLTIGVPQIVPLDGSKFNPCGRGGDIATVYGPPVIIGERAVIDSFLVTTIVLLP